MTSEPIQYQFTLVLNSGSEEIFGKDAVHRIELRIVMVGVVGERWRWVQRF
jgi:hypothetical protein